MIQYDKLWALLEQRGISKIKFKNATNIGGNTFNSLKKNLSVTTDTLNNICMILDCNIEDIIEYIGDENEKQDFIDKINKAHFLN